MAGRNVACPGTRRSEGGLQSTSGRFSLHAEGNGRGLSMSMQRFSSFFFTTTQCGCATISLSNALSIWLDLAFSSKQTVPC